MSIERAGPADAELMAAIHAAAFSSGESWGIDVFRLQLALQGVQGLLHPDGGLVLLRVAADEAEILTLAVIQRSDGTVSAARCCMQRSKLSESRGSTHCFLKSQLSTNRRVPCTPAPDLPKSADGPATTPMAPTPWYFVWTANEQADQAHYSPRLINSVPIPVGSVSIDTTVCPCSVTVRGTLRNGSSPLSRTSSNCPGASLSRARRVLTKVIGQTSRVISISRVTSCIADTTPFYSLCPAAVVIDDSGFI